MKIAVMGAGAVGCYFGAKLALAGHEVVLIGRPALVDVVRAYGLQLESAAYTGRVELGASSEPSAVAGADVVLFCVKSGDTESAGAAMTPHLAPGTTVLSLQNGVDNASRLAGVLGRQVVPVVVYVATDMGGPGHVRHHGRGELVLGPSASSEAVAAAFSAGGVPSEVSDRVAEALWSKLVINCAWNALSAISQQPYGRLVHGHGIVDVMRDVFDECLAVANASGIALGEELWPNVLAIADSMAAQRSSTAQDLARGKRSEIDHLNGFVTTLGDGLGIATPVNRALHAIVRLLESPAEQV